MTRCLLCGWFNLLTDRDHGLLGCHRCRLPLFDIEIPTIKDIP